MTTLEFTDRKDISDIVVGALLGSPQILEAIGDATARRLGSLKDKEVARLLQVSVPAVRKNEALMGISRYIDGVGRRWTCEDLQAYINRHPRGARGRRRLHKATVEEVGD